MISIAVANSKANERANSHTGMSNGKRTIITIGNGIINSECQRAVWIIYAIDSSIKRTPSKA